MRLPRLRFTVGRIMIVVAVAAVLVAAVAAATRPIPVAQAYDFVSGETHWSDGVVTRGYEVPRPKETTYVLFCRLVRWSDGSFSFRPPAQSIEQATLFLILISSLTVIAGMVKLVRDSRTIATLVEENRRLRRDISTLKSEKSQLGSEV